MKKKIVLYSSILVLAIALIAGIIFLVNHFSKDDIGSPDDLSTTPPVDSIVNTPPASGSDKNLDGYILLAGLLQTDPNIPAESPQLSERSYFRPTGGVFSDVSSLTAWDNNEQVLIGATDTATGASVLFDSSSLTSNSWRSAQTVGIFNASGFRVTFSTLGYENIRFSASQSVSENFGGTTDAQIPFEMAFSTSDGVRWTAIHDSGVNVARSNSTGTQTYSNFSIPGVVDNDESVLLRIYLNTASNIPGSGSISINNIKIIGDEITGNAKDVVLMELSEEAANASAFFSATPEDAFYSSSSGLDDSDFRLTGWDNGRPRFIGYTGVTQTPVVFENIMTTRNWTPADGDIARATAFQIQLRTLGYDDITFSAGQISSVNGPDIFKLAFSTDGEIWIPIDDSTRTVSQSSEITTGLLPLTYDKFTLPDEVSRRESVFIRVYFDGTGTGESTSINNIEIWGRPVVSFDGFLAEMLTLQPGRTSRELNITWHDWTMIGTEGKIKYEPAQTASNGFTSAAQTAEAQGVDSYIRRTSHTAAIGGLEPDTQYVYAVSSDGINYSELYTFKTSPLDTFTFVALSDVHMGDPFVSPEDDDSGNNGMLDIKYRPGVTARQGWLDAMDVISETVPNVAFIAAMGDAVDRNLIDMESEPDIHPHQIKWENYFAPRQMRSIPFAPVMGNHESRGNISFRIHFNLPNEIVPGPGEMLPMASTGIQQENENMANYWYIYNNALFVVLNTSTRPRDANENATQDAIIQGLIAHFDDVLTTAKATHEGQYDWLFIQTHKSVSGIAKHSADFDIERFVRFGFEELMLKHEVDIVFTAHDHCYSRSFPLLSNPGPDNFGEHIARSDFRMNNVSYNFLNTSNTVRQGEGTVFFTMNTAIGQKFYSAFAPEFFNNTNYPYLFDGTRGALNMSIPPGENVFLSAGIDTFGPRLPWNVAFYRQEYKPTFIELTVTAESVVVTVYEFAHDIDGNLLQVTVVDNMTFQKVS